MNIKNLLDLTCQTVADMIKGKTPEEIRKTFNIKNDFTPEEEDEVRLAIIGRPNVGKSSLINAILGEERVIVSPIPGTTRDAIDTPFEMDGHKVLLIDTAGIRRAGKVQGSIEYYTVLRAKTAIERCHVGVVVLDAGAGLTDGDKRVAGFAQHHTTRQIH